MDVTQRSHERCASGAGLTPMTNSNPVYTLQSDERDCISQPQEITFAEFMDGLDVLPPIAHVMYSTTETFKWSEFLHARVTRIYCRIEKRYFYMENLVSMRHDDIVQLVRDAMNKAPVAHTSVEVRHHG